MKNFLLVCLVFTLLFVGCDSNATKQYVQEVLQGTVTFHLENDLASLGNDVSYITAKSYKVDIYSNGNLKTSFQTEKSEENTKYVFDDGITSVTQKLDAGVYSAVVYALDSNGKSFGKGKCNFTVISGAVIPVSAVVDCAIHTLDDFVDPVFYDAVYSAGTKERILGLTNTKALPEIKYVDIMNALKWFRDDVYSDSLNAEGTIYRVTNTKNDSFMEINTDREEIYFSSYERFFQTTKSTKEDPVPLFSVVSDPDCKIVGLYEVPGKPLTVSYGYYLTQNDSDGHYALDITPWKKEDGTIGCYIPFNIFTDLCSDFQISNFNGKAVYDIGIDGYYNSELFGKERPKAIAEFNYLDFCFNMDMNYGLASQHNINNGFMEWLENLDEGRVAEKLHSADISKVDEAYLEIVYKYFGDQHSTYRSGTFYEDPTSSDTRKSDFLSNKDNKSTSDRHYDSTLEAIELAKKNSGLITADDNYKGLSLWGYNRTSGKYEELFPEYSDNVTLKVKDKDGTDIENYSNYSDLTLFVTFNSFKYYYNRDLKTLRKLENDETPYYENANKVIKEFGEYENKSVNGYDTRILTVVANKLVKDLDGNVEKEAKNKAELEVKKYSYEEGSDEELAFIAEYMRLFEAMFKLKNIVVDLSMNGGGVVNSEIFIGSWLMGQVDHSVVNPITDAKCVTSYMVDINGDESIGTFDSPLLSDCVVDKRIFALTSRCSFSCGNMLPTQMKATGKAAILGSKTGGGSCVVLPITTVDGTCLNVSGNGRFSLEQNGSFYDTDTGVEADYKFTSWDQYADRAFITSLISNDSYLNSIVGRIDNLDSRVGTLENRP